MHVALGVGVEVLTRAGHAERALALLDEPSIHPPRSVITRFMRALANTNPSGALRLWDHMGLLFGTLPDAHSFTIMLDAARHATLNGDSFAGAIQELGLPFRIPFRRRPTPLHHQYRRRSTERAGELRAAERRAHEQRRRYVGHRTRM
jgi:hypothetical protein